MRASATQSCSTRQYKSFGKALTLAFAWGEAGGRAAGCGFASASSRTREKIGLACYSFRPAQGVKNSAHTASVDNHCLLLRVVSRYARARLHPHCKYRHAVTSESTRASSLLSRAPALCLTERAGRTGCLCRPSCWRTRAGRRGRAGTAVFRLSSHANFIVVVSLLPSRSLKNLLHAQISDVAPRANIKIPKLESTRRYGIFLAVNSVKGKANKKSVDYHISLV